MGVTVKITSHAKGIIKDIEQTAAKRQLESAQAVRTTVLETLSGPRSGRTYYVPGTKKKYTASAPGEPPAQATSKLRQSIKALIEDGIGKVGTNLDYGRMLEFGTRKMKPRPWLRISLEKTRDKIRQIFRRKFM